MKYGLFKWAENAKRKNLQDSAHAEYMWLDSPPPPTDFSPSEPTRAKVIQFITFNNLDVGFPSNGFWNITSVGKYSVTINWQGCCDHMETTEKANYEKYGMISDVADRIIIPNPTDKASPGDKETVAISSEELRFLTLLG